MLGDNIKCARNNKRMTQEELAIRLNVVRQTVSKWEKNLSVPDADLLEKMADILEVDVYALLGNQETSCDKKSAEERLEFIAQQLAKINEREAQKIQNRRKIWATVGIILASAMMLTLLWYVFGKTVGINESVNEVFPRTL